MAKRETTLSKLERDSESEAIEAQAKMMQDGLRTLVEHNKALLTSNAEKDRMLLEQVEHARHERDEFWKFEAQRMQQSLEVWVTLQKLKDREAEREEQRKDRQASRELKEQMYGDGRQLAMVALGQHLKRPMVPQGDLSLVRALLTSLDDAQLEALQGVFRPSQMIAFANIVNLLAAQEKAQAGNGKASEEKPEPTEESSNGAAHH